LFREAQNDVNNPVYKSIQDKVIDFLATTYSPIEVMQACTDWRSGLLVLAKDNAICTHDIERSFNIINQIDNILGAGIVEHESAMFRLVQSRNKDLVIPQIQ
jgi:hypothetical protein